MTRKSWEQNKGEICKEISSSFSPFKIVLKTKNEAILLKRWVDHHSKIVDLNNIIIFDNGSTNRRVKKYLESIENDINIFGFAAMHNSIHQSSGDFKELYSALRASCQYYAFLDTDEFLFWANADGSYFDDRQVSERIAQSAQRVIPGIWAQNLPGAARKFMLSFRKNRMPAGIKGGKPIMSSAVDVQGFLNHNIQLPSDLFKGSTVGNVIIGHLLHFSSDQRIAVNIEKLNSYNRATNVLRDVGLVGATISVDDIINLDCSLLSGNARSYASEIQRLVASDAINSSENKLAAEPAVTFRNNRMSFTDGREKKEILGFLANPAQIIAKTLCDGR